MVDFTKIDPRSSEHEFEERQARELEKAERKYGPEALAPMGHPDRDVHDYAINEIVGLVRYVEMMTARVESFRDLGLIRRKRATGYLIELAELREAVELHGPAMILQRRNLRVALGALGEPEYPEDG